MSRIAARFEALRAAGRTGLVPFLTAGDPDAETTLRALHALVAAGADVVELGVPFSDPMADGPVIQRASERALAAGMTLRGVLELVRRFRESDAETPVVLMGYLNPVERMGYEAFAEAAAAAGADGVLTVDLPPEEGEGLFAALRARGLDPVLLAAPTTPPARLARIGAEGSGFLYYVSLKGVTGAAHLDPGAVAEGVARVRAAVDLPVAVGFGIRDAASAARVGRLADAVVVGSAVVAAMEAAQAAGADPAAAAAEVLAPMRAALDAGEGEP
ncbi:tryptophan synthase subunit alpha [Inmirania thermothiophila]|uniref:Tryptophan synthase alpha chain n=1 Tax=Inmirania thermothiophila TaxID=1750597 RepID=A0A3N1Y1X1_9GAMM|nr:tryptophan synthase subunit alpha [Inmirania thermothiophila]ROR32833.1 tryptophan synthase alpha chain [Inmirania thermothiophila]